jgi:caffeoyl-CoA O-methyltransferase
MLSGRHEGRFLKLLLSLIGARDVVEIGTFTGYSALSMAEALPADGRLITCDVDLEVADIARRYFARSPHGSKIDLRLGPALATIATLAGPFDAAFIDADKGGYGAYYEALVNKIRPGGLILVDNTLWSGGVLAPADDDARAIDALNRRMASDPRIELVILPLRDGLSVARRLA